MHSTMLENGKHCDPKHYVGASQNPAAETGHPGSSASAPAIPIELRFLEQHSGGTVRKPPDWLTEVQEMRARTLYDGGRRPSFQKDDCHFEDADSIDLVAYHVVARSLGQVVGCVRVAPLTRIDSGVVSSAIGEEHLANVLSGLGTTRERTRESSRWIVRPEFRGVLGPRLVAGSWAIARWLSMDIGLVMAGTRQKQDLALIRMGARPVNGVPLEPCELLDDDLRLLYFDVARPPHFMRRRIDEAASALDLTPQFQTRSFASSNS
jgi:hypothetical protein